MAPETSERMGLGRAPGLLFRPDGDQTVVMRVADRQVAVLEGLAALVWDLAEQPVSPSTLADRFGSWLDPDGDAGGTPTAFDSTIEALVSAGLLVEKNVAARLASSVRLYDHHSGHRVGHHADDRPETEHLDSGVRRLTPRPMPLFDASPADGSRSAARSPERSVEAILTAVAVHHLPGAPELDLDLTSDAPLSGAVVTAARHHQLTGSLIAGVRRGLIGLAVGARDDLERAHRDELLSCLYREAELLAVRDRLTGVVDGADVVVLKGPAIAHLDEPDPSWRSFSDVDLLVRADRLDAVVQVLQADGATRPWAQRRPGFDARFAKSVTLTLASGMELDLHRSLCDGVHGFRVPLPRLFEMGQSWDLGGREMVALAPVHRLLHAGHHAVLGSARPKLMSVRDLAGYLSRGEVSVEEATREAELWGGTAVLADAVQVTGSAFGWLPERWARWVDAVEVSDRDRRIIARQQVEGSSFGPAKISALAELAPGDRPAFALGVAFPSRAHLRSRGLTRWAQLSGGRRVRWRRAL